MFWNRKKTILMAVVGLSIAAVGVRSLLADQADETPLWSLQKVPDVPIPEVVDYGWSRNPVDRFLFARWLMDGRQPAGEAERGMLARRLYFDLLGRPPAPDELERLLNDGSVNAYERLVEQLLGSPQYGERWARHWLDVVRYAESDGFKSDVYRPHVWRYRDYVICSLNGDKPYDQFVREQLAGDELFPGNIEALTATGFLRLWPLEDNQKDVQRQWRLILNDVTEVTAEAFLAIGLRCARCHDHKYDPISQRDYYRMQAFFASMLPHDEPLALQDVEHQRRLKWESATADIRREMEGMRKAFHAIRRGDTLSFYPEYLQQIYARSEKDWGPLDRQFVYLAEPQIQRRLLGLKMPSEQQKKIDALAKQLASFNRIKPAGQQMIPAVRDVGSDAPVTRVGGASEGEVVAPGYLSAIEATPPRAATVTTEGGTTGRRSTLAKWITRPDHPLTARVIVNRVWQQHFGRGIVETANDFGHQGSLPSHPKLLDWLARDFVRNGWSIKRLHRLIVTSAAYRQSSRSSDAPEPWLFDGMRTRRLDAEQLRDAMLVASGEMSWRAGGSSIDGEVPRRSVYVKNKRNLHDEMLRAFDAPDMFNSCARRYVTTTPVQSLLMLNGPWSMRRAQAMAKRLAHEFNSRPFERTLQRVYRLCFGRPPREEEVAAVAALMESSSSFDHDDLLDLCHVLMCSNEFAYVD